MWASPPSERRARLGCKTPFLSWSHVAGPPSGPTDRKPALRGPSTCARAHIQGEPVMRKAGFALPGPSEAFGLAKPIKNPLGGVFLVSLSLSSSLSVSLSFPPSLFLSLLHFCFSVSCVSGGHISGILLQKERPLTAVRRVPLVRNPFPGDGGTSSPAPPHQGGDCRMVFQLVETNRSRLLASRTMNRPT